MEFGKVSVYKNLAEALYQGRQLAEKGITFIRGREEERFLSYQDLYRESLQMLGHLQKQGLRPGDEVVILVEDQEQYVRILWACILGGMVPVITPPGVTEEERFMLFQVCRILQRPNIVATAEMVGSDQYFLYHSDYELMMKLENRTWIYEEFTTVTEPGEVYDADPDATAIILFSSGSTGEPKGITHSHRTILQAFTVFAMGGTMSESEIFLCWTPLTHALGLNGWHIMPTVLHVNQYLMRKDLFVNDPTFWFEQANQRRATVLVSPNFGYKHFLKLFEPERAEGWDLSCVRLIYNAAEPISAPLCEEFLSTMTPYGLRRTAMCPFYGMTETGLVISQHPAEEEFNYLCVDTKEMVIGQRIQLLAPGSGSGTLVVNVGRPIMGVRICDDEMNRLPETVVGHVQIQGINITPGYYENMEATQSAWTEDGWFKTGDVGFLFEGRLYVTGRAKDIIFVNGRNYFPHDIERVAHEADGCSEDLQIAVCGLTDEREQGELMLGFVVSELPLAEFAVLAQQIQMQVSRKMGLWLAHVLPVDNLPKTRSGKLQRYRLGEMYKRGEFAEQIASLKELTRALDAHKAQISSDRCGVQSGEDVVEAVQAGVDGNIVGGEATTSVAGSEWVSDSRMTSGQLRPVSRDTVEGKLLAIAADILEEEITEGVKFFEICGDSLKMIQMVGKINREFGITIRVTDIFKYNTISEIADFLKKNALATAQSGEKGYAVNGLQSADERVVTGSEGVEAGHFDIAVIGMAGRFPEADDLQAFWANLTTARCSVRAYPGTRREELRGILGELADVEFVEQGYLDQITYFEPEVFGIHPEEARYIDPQQRLLLELVEEAVLDAGYAPTELAQHQVGVFLSTNENDYGKHIDAASMLAFVNRVTATNAARIAYVYNFHGPVMSIDSACSSSLVALHTACQYLRLGEMEYAIVGGAQAKLVPPTEKNIAVNPTLSPDFRARAFASDANGTVDGEGGGILILKSLRRAVADGDMIHAVIKGSAVNSNGNRASSINAPNEVGQAEAVITAIDHAGIDPLSISYIETHGTGTRIGDPIEVAGLSEALTRLGYSPRSVLIGSLKSNIGHLIGASGVANMLKTILSLKHKAIPASIHFNEPNPLIDFEHAPVHVNNRLREWKSKGIRRAGVTALGLTGTNAHFVLEEAPERENDEFAKEYPQIITLSARTEYSLMRMIERLERYVSSHLELSIHDIAFTLNTGRRLYSQRCVMVARSAQDLLNTLRNGRYDIFYPEHVAAPSVVVLLPRLEQVRWDEVNGLYEKNLHFRQYWDAMATAVGGMFDVHDQRIRYAMAGYAYVQMLHAYGIISKEIHGEGWGQEIADSLRHGCALEALLNRALEWNVEPACSQNGLQGAVSVAVERGDQVLLFPVDQAACKTNQWGLLADAGAANPGESFLYQVAGLMKEGLCVDWQSVYQGTGYKRVSLPGYVFDRQSYFVPGTPFALAVHEMETVGLRAVISPDDDRDPDPRGGSGARGGQGWKTSVSGQAGFGAQEQGAEQSTFADHPADVATEQNQRGSHPNENQFALGTGGYQQHPDAIYPRLKEMMTHLLFGGKYHPEAKFFDTGVNSVGVIHFIGKLRQEFGVELNVVDFFDDVTVDELFHNVFHMIQTGLFGEEGIPQQQTEQAYYPTSAVQKRLFIISQFGTDTSYNVPIFLHGKGRLDQERLKAAFQKLIQRHEALRTTFAMVDDEVVQQIHREGTVEYYQYQAPMSEWDERIAEFIKPFDLHQLPLVRFGLAEDGDHILLMIDMHHIIFDGVSLEIIMNEWAALYDGQSLPEQRLQYKDFAVWQQDFLQSETVKAQAEYWLERFRGEIPVLNLPTDFPRPATRSTDGDTIIFKMDREMTQHLQQFAASQGVTLYMALLAAFHVTLAFYSGQEDTIIGCPITGRRHGDMEKIVGMFVNTLAMRNQSSFNKRYVDFLKEVKFNALKAYENQDAQFEELVERLALDRDLSRNPLFDVMFAVQNANSFENELGGVPFSLYQFRNQAAKYDLTMHAYVVQGEIRFSLEYYTRIFKESTIQRFAQHFLQIITDTMEHPEATIAAINPLSPEEKELLLCGFNDTTVEYPVEKSIVQLFEEQVERTPDQVALTFDTECWTYRELNERANQLARLLRKKGVHREEIVGIFMERSMELFLAILAIVKAGGAYLPIDPDYPESRIAYLLQDAQVRLLLTTQEVAGVEIIDPTDPMILEEDRANLPIISEPADLIYVIYTSGSTGEPKGVMVEHRQVNRLVMNSNMLVIAPDERILQTGSIAFDASTFEIWGTWLNGATLCLIRKEDLLVADRLEKICKNYGITMTWMTAPLLQQLWEVNPAIFAGLRTIITGGDAPSPKHINAIRKTYPELKVINAYGPTETVVFTTYYVIEKEYTDSIPIGKPVSNTKVYILSAAGQLLPVGVSGELCIGGDAVARGYLNAPERTAEKFIPDPFNPGQRLYRSGDLTRWLPDGNIEFLGRIDHQVKIRGFRVEPAEIENHLLKHPALKEACVLVQTQDNGDKYLTAFLTATSEISVAEIRAFLAERLPEHMIPSYIVLVEAMPLTINGKMDRKALMELDVQKEAVLEYEPPTTDDERKMAQIWSEILGIEQIGVNTNFFEIGGHSLRATQLSARVQKEWNVELPLIEIFKRRTIRELVSYLHRAEVAQFTAIPLVAERPYYPASSAQKRIYLIRELEGANTAYNMPYFLEIEGRLDRHRLKDALFLLVQRHDAFRTSFRMIDEELMQVIRPTVELTVEELDGTEERLEQILQEFVRPFDLSEAPLLRVGLVQCECREIMMLDMHHIISDGVSLELFFKELFALYGGEQLPELTLQYKDFSAWQNDLLRSDAMKAQETYWLERLSGELPMLSLPTDYPRPVERTFAGRIVHFELDEEWSRRVHQLANAEEATPYMVLLANLHLLLARYTGQNETLIGTPIAGRNHADLEQVMGMFVNTLVMRNESAGQKNFIEFLREVKVHALEAFAHQDYQFEMLVEALHHERTLNRNALFDVMFIWQNQLHFAYTSDELRTRPYPYEYDVTKFDLTLHAYEMGERIQFNLEYSTELFRPETIARLKDHLIQVVKTAVTDPTQPIGQMDLLTASERQQILGEFNDTTVDYPAEKSLVQLFEEQVERTPDQVALTFGAKSWTYRELNEQANLLARQLREKGVQREEIVGIFMERSMEMFLAILAIVKAGGAYLPIDPDYPESRIAYLLQDAQVRLLFTTHAVAGVETIDPTDPTLLQGDGANLSTMNQPTDLLYVIYTSGSTGEPKGVMVEHRQVNRLVMNSNMLVIAPDERILQTGSIAFDASTFEIWGTWLNGATLCLIHKEDLLVADRLAKVCKDYRITMSWFTAPLFQQLWEENPAIFAGLRTIIVGGDALSPKHINALRRTYPDLKVINGYGPTETVVFATYHIIEKEYTANIPIGRPLTNTKAYILSADGQLLPVGVSGELCIGGDAVARGYLHAPERTAEKFIPDPFNPGQRLYRSGDLTRWLPDGNIEFLGRIDHQVKIRGFRVEPGEIENHLLKHPALKEACVLVQAQNNGEKYLTAFLTSTSELSVAEIRTFLAERLPEHMIPSYIVLIESMPLTTNGKIDRKALMELDVQKEAVLEYEAPTTDAEQKMAHIWTEILGIEQVGVNTSFFEMGGHSLKATQLIAKVRKEFEVELPLKAIFQARTIRGLLAYMDGALKVKFGKIAVVASEEYADLWKDSPQLDYQRETAYPVSSAQKRLFMVHQLSGKTTTYNMPQFFVIEGKLDRARLLAAFQQLIQRHESLRTRFIVHDGQVYQVVAREVELPLWRPEGLAQVTEANLETILRTFVQPFDLTQAPLIRVGLVEMAADRHLLLMDMHHIISDGVSLSVLYHDLSRLYAGDELPEIRVQYKDFSAWQNQQLQSPAMQAQEAFWLETFAGEIPVLNLPTDQPRPTEMSFEGNSYSFVLDHEISERIRELSTRNGGTLFMTLLACFNLLLHKYSGQDDIIVGTAVAGRQHTDLNEIIGMFVNTLPMRNRPVATQTFAEFLAQVQENALKALENQDYQLEMLIDRLQLDRDMSRNPLFDVVFGVQNMADAALAMGELHFTAVPYTTYTAKFDLAVAAMEKGEEIRFDVEYSTHLFTEATIVRMSQHLRKIIDIVTADPEVRLRDVEIITESEKAQILNEFNATYNDYPKEKPLPQLFEEQAIRVPDRPALIFHEQQVTYAELNAKANQLARRLRSAGVGRDQIVGLCIERSMEMFIGILGILKAGGAYLPIDPAYPKARKEFMLADCGVQILLTQTALLEDLKTCTYGGDTICLDDPELYTGDAANLPQVNLSSDLAYVMYTSGTTGQPKGSLIMHYNITRLVMKTDYVEVHEDDRLLQLSNFAFDGSTTDIYMTLLHGAALVLVTREEVMDLALIAERIRQHGVTMFFATTALFHLMVDLYLDRLTSLRAVLFGGEQVSVTHVEKARTVLGNGKLINGYGPTETTACATAYTVTKECKHTVPIGSPLANNTVYILDEAGHLQPIGVPGEIYIGGDGLCRGYLNQPELTAAKFVLNPFLTDHGAAGDLQNTRTSAAQPHGFQQPVSEAGMNKPAVETRLYRTGDLGRWLPDGNIECLGRIDNQVKIRGFRIEPTEIENHLRAHEAVREAAVLVKTDATRGKYLAAYLESSEALTVQVMKDYLATRVPEYMIPSAFVFLESMPFNANGKIDRRSLPEPGELAGAGETYVAPTLPLEEAIARIWASVLKLDRVGIHDRFFDLGGHSLKATEAVAWMQKELEVELTVADLFRNPTVARLAAVIAERERTVFQEIAAVKEQNYYSLSFAQRRMWYLYQMQPESSAYNMPDQIRLKEAVDPVMIQEVLIQLIHRHESFRTRITTVNGNPVQVIEDEVSLPFTFVDLSDLPLEERYRKRDERFRADAVQPFQLDQAPILRFTLVKLDEAEYELQYNNHHIISDGWSTEIFKREFHQLYAGLKQGGEVQLPLLRVQYKDFAVWQDALFADTNKMRAAKEFWASQLRSELEALHLPRDYQHPLVENQSASYRFAIPAAVHEGLKALTGEYQTSLFTVLLAGFQFFLSRITKQEEVFVGIPVVGRDHDDLKNIIGFFVNTTIASLQINQEETFGELLERVKANVMQTLAYQTYPLELITNELKMKYPPISVFFNMLNLFDADGEELTNFDAYHLSEVPAVKFEIACYLREYANGIEVYCNYCTAIFRPETIELMMTRYAQLLTEIAADSTKPVIQYGQPRAKRRLI